MGNVKFGGVYKITHLNSKGEVISFDEVHNLVPNEGLTYFNGVIFGGAAASSHFVGLYANNYAVIPTDTMATFLASASEVTAYDESARQLYNATVDGNEVQNSASKAVFTINADVTARGAFISTSSVKGGTVGTLVTAALFTSPKVLTAGDTLTIEYLFVGSSS